VVVTQTNTEVPFEVPAGVHSIAITAVGQNGANGSIRIVPSVGRGGVVSGTLAVVPGQTLYAFVGDNGFLSDGGAASEVRTIARAEPSSEGSRILVAGGGGAPGGGGSGPNGGGIATSRGGQGGNAGTAGENGLGGRGGEGGKPGTTAAAGLGGLAGPAPSAPNCEAIQPSAGIRGIGTKGGRGGESGACRGQGGSAVGGEGGEGGDGYFGGGGGGGGGAGEPGTLAGSGGGGGGGGSNFIGASFTSTSTGISGLSQEPSITFTYSKPTVTITAPVSGAKYEIGTTVDASYTCAEGGGNAIPCSGTVANGSPIDTGSLGTKTFEVTATDASGNETTATVEYEVVKAKPTLTVGTTTSPALGQALEAQGHLSGGYKPMGIYRVKVFKPGDTTCAEPFTEETQSSLPGTAPAGSAETLFGPRIEVEEAGTYRYLAEFEGDTNNEAAASTCGEAGSTFTVAKNQPTLTSQASAGVAVGGSVYDEATLAGSYHSGGSVEFKLYGPSDPTCTGTPAFTSPPVMVNGDDEYESEAFTPLAVGTYTWVATYGGDGNNLGAASECGEASAQVVVGQASSTTTLSASPTAALTGATVTLTAKVDGQAPGGTVTFLDGQAKLGSASLAGGTASLSTTALGVGTHTITVEYGGDSNNLASTSAAVTVTISAPAEVKVTPPPVIPPPPSPPMKPRVGYSPNVPHTPNPEGGARWTFHFGGAGAGATFLCRLDKGGFEPCHSPKVYRHLKPGKHHFAVRAISATGEESPVSKVTFQVGKKGGRGQGH
jgi:hypothetical protein